MFAFAAKSGGGAFGDPAGVLVWLWGPFGPLIWSVQILIKAAGKSGAQSELLVRRRVHFSASRRLCAADCVPLTVSGQAKVCGPKSASGANPFESGKYE